MSRLILTRRVNETLCIGEDVFVTVLAINRSDVRLGITAPLDIPVHRQEVYARIQADKKTLEKDE